MASGEFDTVRREYPRTPWAEAALYRIGLCEFRQFKGIDYDPKPLEAARRQLEKFLLDYPSSSLSDEAKKTLSEVKSILARKALAVADYYSARGRETGARFMYAAVATDYPETEAGRTAAETLKTLPEPEPDPQ